MGWVRFFVMLLGLATLSFHTPAFAQSSGGIGNSKDKDKPVEIAADNLEVQRDNQLAIFRGNVEAVQGSTRIRADSMVVYYRDSAGRDAANQAAQAAGDNSRTGKISRIDAFKGVFISSDNETAKGDKAVYDLDRRIMVIEGNAVLTRNDDVLSCAKLTANLDNKQNVCETQPGGRVKGIFNPGTKKSADDKKTN